MVTSTKGLGPEKDYAGEGQKTDPDLSSERAPNKNETVNVKE
jgi:hypothetical protein